MPQNNRPPPFQPKLKSSSGHRQDRSYPDARLTSCHRHRGRKNQSLGSPNHPYSHQSTPASPCDYQPAPAVPHGYQLAPPVPHDYQTAPAPCGHPRNTSATPPHTVHTSNPQVAAVPTRPTRSDTPFPEHVAHAPVSRWLSSSVNQSTRYTAPSSKSNRSNVDTAGIGSANSTVGHSSLGAPPSHNEALGVSIRSADMLTHENVHRLPKAVSYTARARDRFSQAANRSFLTSSIHGQTQNRRRRPFQTDELTDMVDTCRYCNDARSKSSGVQHVCTKMLESGDFRDRDYGSS